MELSKQYQQYATFAEQKATMRETPELTLDVPTAGRKR
jgi:hypothetical protein